MTNTNFFFQASSFSFIGITFEGCDRLVLEEDSLVQFSNFINCTVSVNCDSTCLIDHCHFSGSINNAIYGNLDSSITVTSTTIETTSDAAAIYVGAELNVFNSTLRNNNAKAVTATDDDSFAHFENTLFDSNYGTAVDLYGRGSFVNCTFVNNTANSNAGALYAKNDASIKQCKFIDNHSASGSGGAIYATGTISVINSTFSGNTAPRASGIQVYDANCTLLYCLFDGNKANTGPGTVHFSQENTYAEVIGCTFTSNIGKNGAGVNFESKASGVISNSTFSNNTATDGTIYLSQATQIYIFNTKIIGNLGEYSGVKAQHTANLSIVGCNISSNNGTGAGVAINSYFITRLTISSTNIENNNAIDGAPIYFSSTDSLVNIVDSTIKSNSGYYGAIRSASPACISVPIVLLFYVSFIF